ncbi:hypothetical protein N7530_000838 [Penicillium desertorum]|uniref:2EXR domain-containing protein n=1 Tax=Penicillium desertorum TaxID=1303715 RepID=A0A9X0BVS0_9EURO|nr:hypothetical protein N7530_000838 [Penicillium desertorum]
MAAANSQTFHLFPYLPPELRAMTWRASLPENDPPAIAPYQGGSWNHSPVPATSIHSMEWEYHFNLGVTRVKIPLTSVNHEARDVAITWAHKRGIEVIFNEVTGCNIYIRRHDPVRDIIWFGEGAFQSFARQCLDMQMASGQNAIIPVPIQIGQFAIPKNTLTDRWFMRSLRAAMHSFCGDVLVWIIADEHPSFHTNTNHEKAPPRWEVGATHEGESIFWDGLTGRLEVGGGAQILNDHSYERLIEAGHAIAERLAATTHGVTHFGLQAAYAVRL